MLTFVLFDSCVFQGLGLGLAGFSTINLRLLYLKLIVSAIYSLSRWKNEETLDSLTEYNIIYTHFLYIFFNVFLLFTGADKLKKIKMVDST